MSNSLNQLRLLLFQRQPLSYRQRPFLPTTHRQPRPRFFQPAPQSTPTSSPTPAPTLTPTATIILTLAIWSDGQTAVSQPSDVITSDNVTQVAELSHWGRGLINDIALSSNGRWLAVATTTGVYIHDTEAFRAVPHHIPTNLNVENVAISSEGQLAALNLVNGRLEIRSLADDQLLQTIAAHEEAVTAVAYLSNGDVASAGLDCTTYIWNPADGTQRLTLEQHISPGVYTGEPVPSRTLELLADSETNLLFGVFSNHIGIWNIENGSLVNVVEAHGYETNSIATSSSKLAFGEGAFSIFTFDDNGELSEQWTFEADGNGLAFSPDGELLVAGSGINYRDIRHNGSIHLHIADSGVLLHEMNPISDRVTSIAFAENGRFFVSTTQDGIVRLWGIP